jgi:hypothetical protein
MTTTEIRHARPEVRDAGEVPPVDALAFRRRVRSERRRRSAARVVAAGTAAAAVAAVVSLASGVGPGAGRSVDPAPADRPSATGTVDETVFFVLDGRLTALDPTGRVHDLGVRAEGVVGFTSERVFAVDDRSHLVVRTVSYDEGSGGATFGREESPVPGAVQTATLSGDGRYLGWTGTDDVSHRYDLKAGREDLTLPGTPLTGVVGVSADGLLLYTPDGLELDDGTSSLSVPVSADGEGAASQVSAGQVLVNGRDGRSRLYDLTGGSARPVDTLAGFGVLGPYAERIAVLVLQPADRTRLEVWDGGTSTPVSGLGDEIPDQARWADETTLLVAAHDGQRGDLFACDIELACRRLPVDGEVNLNR